MSFVSQVDAHMAEARGHLARARQQPENWPFCGSALARALEYGACAVFIAWGEPYKADRRMHGHFDERLAPLLDLLVAPVVDGVWAYEGNDKPEDVKAFIAACEHVISIFTELATNAPLPGWQVRPARLPIGWDALSYAEQSFLRAALAAARAAGIEVRMLLFGSRAAGMARPDSDFDVLFVFPDSVPASLYGQAVGRVVSLALASGIDVDTPTISETDWIKPPMVHELLVNRVKACHVEVRD